MLSGGLDRQEIAQGASLDLGALAVLPASQVQLGLSDHVPAGWFGHSRRTPGLLALAPTSSDCTNSNGNSYQDKTP